MCTQLLLSLVFCCVLKGKKQALPDSLPHFSIWSNCPTQQNLVPRLPILFFLLFVHFFCVFHGGKYIANKFYLIAKNYWKNENDLNQVFLDRAEVVSFQLFPRNVILSFCRPKDFECFCQNWEITSKYIFPTSFYGGGGVPKKTCMIFL